MLWGIAPSNVGGGSVRSQGRRYSHRGCQVPGVGISIVFLAVGAILDFAVTGNTDQHGFNINTVGLILMVLGGVGLLVSLIVFGARERAWYGPRRKRTVVDDGYGHVAQREDIYD